MTKGFVTMATGDERYYKMAVNLLNSYRYFTKEPYKFAIISDQKNEYTDQFDDAIIIENAQKNYMDKIRLLEICPYDENIFIDADCLAYSDLNSYWEVFENADDFSAFGKTFPIDSTLGWYNKDTIGSFGDRIKYVTHLHGVIYFIRPGAVCNQMLELCYKIIENYDKYNITGFPEAADEPVFAIAMGIMDLKPVIRKTEHYVFLPIADYINADISKGYLEYGFGENEKTNKGMLVHWANVNIDKALYKKEIMQLGFMTKKQEINYEQVNTYYKQCETEDKKKEKIRRRLERRSELKSKIYKIVKRI